VRLSSPLALAMVLGVAACVGPSRAWSQADAGAQIEREAGVVQVTGASVAELAGFVVAGLQESGAVPDWLQAKTTEGRVQRLSATDGFVVMARLMRQWDVDGTLPESVSVAVGAVNPPVLSVADLPEAVEGEAEPRVIPTDLFVAQSAEVVRCLGQFRMVPAAVWVDRERLAAQDYMAGMAIAIDYAYRNHKVEPAIAIARFLPAPAWAAYTEQCAEYVEEEVTEGDAGTQEEGFDGGTAPPEEEAPSPPAEATLFLAPDPKEAVSGAVDLIASYSGPPAKFVTFLVDDVAKAITNTAPYWYRWDTTRLPPGPHRVRVRVLGQDDIEIASMEATYTIAAPAPPAPKAKK
jgi:hypothetical protein